MSETMNDRPQMVDGVMVLSRFFAAPREVVWRAWTEADQFQRWFGPRECTIPYCTMDVRLGGTFHLVHRMADGKEVWSKGIFRIVDPPQHLEWDDFFSDPEGNLVEHPGYPRQMRITVSFEERPGGTEITVRHAGLLSDQGESQGWIETLDRLAEQLAS